MNHRIALFLAPSLALVAGCSSSSRRSADGGLAAPAAIVVDTSRAGTYGLDARIDVLALERGDGSFTPNLLSGSATVAIARPSGTSDGLALAELPPGVYVALRLLLAEDGVVATDAQGRRETVAVASRDVRVAFARPVDWQGGGIRWLGLQSVAEPELQRDASGRLVWMPHLAVRPGDLQPVTRAVFTVTAVQGEEVSGVLASCGRLPVRARFHEDCVLSDDGGPRDRGGFLRDLRGNDEIECDGTLAHDGVVHVRRAHRRGRGPSASSKIHGDVVELRPAVPAIAVQVREVVRGGAGIGSPLPVLVVHTAGAKIHRSGFPQERLGFEAFAVGQVVEVEWRGGAIVRGTVAAHEVEIEDERGRFGPESEGRVDAVDLQAGTIRVVPRGDDPLVVGGRRVPHVLVVVTPSTVIVRDHAPGRRSIALAEVAARDRIWFWGRVVEPQKVEASAIRVRADR